MQMTETRAGALVKETPKHCDRAEQSRRGGAEGYIRVSRGVTMGGNEARHVAGQGRNCKRRCMEHWKLAHTVDDLVERSTTWTTHKSGESGKRGG
jgi:hypothetical protein